MNTHDMPLPCHIVCKTVEEALWLRDYVEDSYAAEEWIQAFNDNAGEEGFVVQFENDGDIGFWAGWPDYSHDVDGELAFCEQLIDCTEPLGKFSDTDLEVILIGN